MSSSRLCRRGTLRRCEKVPRRITPLSLNTSMRSGVVEHSAAVSIESPLGGATGGGGASIAAAAARSRITAASMRRLTNRP